MSNSIVKNRQIAIVTPSLGIGGREKVLSLLMNFFSDKKEINVNLILYGKNRVVHFDLNSNIKIHTPPFEYSEYPSSISLIKTIFFIRSILKQLDIDIIISFEEKWNRLVLLSTFGLGIKTYISNRNHPYRDYGFFDRLIARYLYPTAEVLIAQTQVAKKIYERKYRLKKCVVIGNPINQLPENRINRENVVVSVGRLMNSKHHERLVKIFTGIDNPDWRLVIVGGDFADHNNFEKLSLLIRELGMEKRIELTGFKKDVNAYLLRSKIFAFTSDREGFPNAIGEAMAAGLPVIAYDCLAGPSEMIDDGINGYLIPVFDDELFKEKLEFLMKNNQVSSRMGENAKEKIKKFDSITICQQFYDLILG